MISAPSSRSVHSRLSAFGIYVDSPAIRRQSDDAIVAMLTPSDALALVEFLELGMPLDHALRAVRSAQVAHACRMPRATCIAAHPAA